MHNPSADKIPMIAKSPLRTTLLVQLSLCAISCLLALVLGKTIAWSIFYGCVIYIVANAYFTHYAFRYKGSELMPWIKQSFMLGQMGKLSLAALGFAIVFAFVETYNVVALFVGFSEMIILQWWLGSRVAKAASANELS